MFIAVFILWLAGIYIVIGAAFGVLFLARGICDVDGTARGASWAVRIVLFPGVVAFWPLMWRKWSRAGGVRHA